ncbi:MAG: ATP-binding protein [Chloroflexota bacterium]|nr:ATP-binding protein [Chloroflexota bacterium]
MEWHFHPVVIPVVLTLLALATFAVQAWQQRDDLTAHAFFYVCALAFAAITTNLLQIIIRNDDLLVTLEIICLLPWLYFTVAGVIFTASYTGHERWITRRNVIAICIVPTLFLLLSWTNPLHFLVWTDIIVVHLNGLNTVIIQYNLQSPVVWIGVPHIFLLTGLAAYMLIRFMVSQSGLFTKQASLLLLACAIPAVGLVIDFSVETIDFAGMTIGLACIPLGFSVLRFRFLDIMPAAHDAIMQSIADAVIVIDGQHRVVNVNPAAERLLNVARQQIVGHELATPLASLNIAAHFNYSSEVQRVIQLTAHGVDRHYDLRISPLASRFGATKGHILVLHDITLLKQAQEQALELARERERNTLMHTFLVDAAHDLRTPATAIGTGIYLLSKHINELSEVLDEQAPEQSLQLLSRMDERLAQTKANAARLKSLLDSLTDMVRMNEHEPLQFQPTDLNVFVPEIIAADKAAATDKGVRLEFSPGEPLPFVALNRSYFARAIQNLVENAVRYTPTGGYVQISTRATPTCVHLEVKDSGIGIEPQDLPHIFNPFYRADKARQIQSGGIGLGLAIVQKVVQTHKSTIEVDSTPGTGTTFRILLPHAQVSHLQ